MRIVSLIILLFAPFLSSTAYAQFRIDSNVVRSDTSTVQPDEPKDNRMWVMGVCSLTIDRPGFGAGENPIGLSIKFGAIYDDRILQFAYHRKGGSLKYAIGEFQRESALLYGFSFHNTFALVDAGVGVSMANYNRIASVVTEPSTSTSNDGVFKVETGFGVGVALSAEAYFTPIPAFALWGIGIYGTLLTKGQSHFSVEFSLLEFNFPIPGTD